MRTICEHGVKGQHRWRAMKLWPGSKEIMFRACRFCADVQLAKLDPIHRKLEWLEPETLEKQPSKLTVNDTEKETGKL